MGATGGYADVQLDATTFRVEFSGNGFTARSRVEAFVLYRCAELTLEHGFSHFAVLNGGTSAENSTVNLPSTTNGNVTVVGNTAYWNSTTTPGQQIPVTKFGSTVMIRTFRGRPVDVPSALDAAQVMAYLGPQVRKGSQAPQATPAAFQKAAAVRAAPAKSPVPVQTLVPTEIASEPSNAEVYVDGELVGMTPLSAYPLPPGTRRIEVVVSGAPTRVVAELEEGSPTDVEHVAATEATPPPLPISAPVPPQPRPSEPSATLYVRTMPRGVELLINGRSMGVTTPDGLSVEVQPGEVVLELRLSGYASEQRRYTATPGKKKTFGVWMRRE